MSFKFVTWDTLKINLFWTKNRNLDAEYREPQSIKGKWRLCDVMRCHADIELLNK